MRALIKASVRSPFTLEKAYYSGISFSVAAKETAPMGIAFRTTGLKMYVIGETSDAAHEYNLSTAWDISTATFSQSFSVSAQDSRPDDLAFSSDGTRMFFPGVTGVAINEYGLSTAWDISTASFTQSFSVVAEGDTPVGLAFKTDGTKMFTVDPAASNTKVFEYSLSATWDVSTATFVQSFNIAGQNQNPGGVAFSTSGTRMFVTAASGGEREINEYGLSTAWDISTASFVRVLSVSDQDTQPDAVTFDTNGTRMYVVGVGNKKIYQYFL